MAPLALYPVILVGLVLLAHAGYSVHELVTLYGTTASVPRDVVAETIFAVVVLLFANIASASKSSPLQPIAWREWAGQIEKQKTPADNARHPFRRLEDRRGFWDVRASRQEFRERQKTADKEKAGETAE